MRNNLVIETLDMIHPFLKKLYINKKIFIAQNAGADNKIGIPRESWIARCLIHLTPSRLSVALCHIVE